MHLNLKNLCNILVAILILAGLGSVYGNTANADPPKSELDDWLLLYAHAFPHLVRADGSGLTGLRQATADALGKPDADMQFWEWGWTEEGYLAILRFDEASGVSRNDLDSLESIMATDGTVLPVVIRLYSEGDEPDMSMVSVVSSRVSPDGRWIAAAGYINTEGAPSSASADTGFYLFDNFGGGTQAELYIYEFGSTYFRARTISWSPDSQNFVYDISSNRNIDSWISRLYIINIREGVLPGHEPTALTKDPLADDSLERGEKSYNPAWSLDGNYIAYVCDDAGLAARLCLIQPDGTNRKVLFPDMPMPHIYYVAWAGSAEAQKLVWVTADGAIYLLEGDCLPDSCTLEDIRIFDYAASVNVEQFSEDSVFMNWHHDGRHVVHGCWRQEVGMQVCMLDSQTGNLWQITDFDYELLYPGAYRYSTWIGWAEWQPRQEGE